MPPTLHPAAQALVADFLGALFTDVPGVIEIRALPSKRQHFGRLPEEADRSRFLAQHGIQDDLYVGVATRGDDTSGKGDNLVALSSLFADVDFKTTPEAEVREALDAFPLPATLIVRSGGGLHCYWGLREPLPVDTEADRDVARGFLRRLAVYLGADLSAAEPARILRIPGTMNRKPVYARPVPVQLEQCEPDRRYNLRELDEWLPPAPAPSSGRFHTASTPIHEGGRHLYLFRAARSLKARGLTLAAVLAALRVENDARCLPPLSPSEVERQVRSAFEQADRPGFTPTDAAANNGTAPADDLGLGLIPIGTLLSEPEAARAWVVSGRLPAGGLGLLAGKPKAGKSTKARCLAYAVARGDPWLGFATVQGPVLYLALEEKRDEVKDHFRTLGATDRDPIFVLFGSAPIDALERLRYEVEIRKPVLIIIDPLFRFVRVDDGNDYAIMTRALEPLLQLARESSAAILLVHHLGKGDRTDGDNVLGSTAIFGVVDVAFLLKRGDKYRTLSTIQRYGTDLEEITVTLDPETRTVHAGPPRTEAEQADAAQQILTYLKEVPGPQTEPELKAGTECRTGPFRAALRSLVATGILRRTGGGKKGDPFQYVQGTRIPGEGGG